MALKNNNNAIWKNITNSDCSKPWDNVIIEFYKEKIDLIEYINNSNVATLSNDRRNVDSEQDIFQFKFQLKYDEDDQTRKYFQVLINYRIYDSKNMVLYAQRSFLEEYFDEIKFNLEDFDAPYDWDHIIASNQVIGKSKVNVPKILKSLHYTIGNQRAWPYSLNRADGEKWPNEKFESKHGSESDHIDFLSASFCTQKINDGSIGWKDIGENHVKSEQHWPIAANLIISRMHHIFNEWASSLEIQKLLKDNTQENPTAAV